jgi:uncharacterized protein with ATP-grasp and redox domains
MEVFLDCIPCVLRQAVEAARLSTEDEALQKQIVAEVIGVLGEYDVYGSAPGLMREFHRIIKARTGVADPYTPVKQRDLQTALRLLPALKRTLAKKDDRLYWALKAAATGNVLDSAIALTADTARLEEEFETPFTVCDLPVFAEQLQTARHILVIGDNTGETVFDGLLLEQFPHLRLTYAVRSAPAINDATMAEAVASGLDAYADIVSTGCDIPGVLLPECSAEFLDLFNGADIVIAKGQGNYETLSDSSRGIFFLLKAKCPVIARVLGVNLNDFIFRYQAGAR